MPHLSISPRCHSLFCFFYLWFTSNTGTRLILMWTRLQWGARDLFPRLWRSFPSRSLLFGPPNPTYTHTQKHTPSLHVPLPPLFSVDKALLVFFFITELHRNSEADTAVWRKLGLLNQFVQVPLYNTNPFLEKAVIPVPSLQVNQLDPVVYSVVSSTKRAKTPIWPTVWH